MHSWEGEELTEQHFSTVSRNQQNPHPTGAGAQLCTDVELGFILWWVTLTTAHTSFTAFLLSHNDLMMALFLSLTHTQIFLFHSSRTPHTRHSARGWKSFSRACAEWVAVPLVLTHLKLRLEGAAGQQALDNVGPVQTIHAVTSEDSSLLGQWLPFRVHHEVTTEKRGRGQGSGLG